MKSKTGWFNKNKLGNTPKYESYRHSLASKGIKTARPKSPNGFSSSGVSTPNFDMIARDRVRFKEVGCDGTESVDLSLTPMSHNRYNVFNELTGYNIGTFSKDEILKRTGFTKAQLDKIKGTTNFQKMPSANIKKMLRGERIKTLKFIKKLTKKTDMLELIKNQDFVFDSKTKRGKLFTKANIVLGIIPVIEFNKVIAKINYSYALKDWKAGIRKTQPIKSKFYLINKDGTLKKRGFVGITDEGFVYSKSKKDFATKLKTDMVSGNKTVDKFKLLRVTQFVTKRYPLADDTFKQHKINKLMD